MDKTKDYYMHIGFVHEQKEIVGIGSHKLKMIRELMSPLIPKIHREFSED